MIDRRHDLSIARQAMVLGISRGSVYYKSRSVSDAKLKLMHRIDKLHMEFPFVGSRMRRGCWCRKGSVTPGSAMPRSYPWRPGRSTW